MKFKVGIFQVNHKGDIDIEAENKVDAARKASELLDTENGTYILVAELNSPEPVMNICMKDIVQVIDSGLKPKYPLYPRVVVGHYNG